MRDRIFGRSAQSPRAGSSYRRSLENVAGHPGVRALRGARVLETDSGERITAPGSCWQARLRVHVPDVPGTDLPGVHTSDAGDAHTGAARGTWWWWAAATSRPSSATSSGLGSSVTQLNRSQRLLRRRATTRSPSASPVRPPRAGTSAGVEPHGRPDLRSRPLTVSADASDSWEAVGAHRRRGVSRHRACQRDL
ncbi:hypothetical protein QJS66_05755 [Kocuria rhizophila]|nr:hypothetical protein QJS66_05755 [Kocuria rhizophila]